MPATSGGGYASAKRIAGNPDSGAPDRFASRRRRQRDCDGDDRVDQPDRDPPDGVVGAARRRSAVITALTPITTPPQPGTAVNAPARSIVSRMKRRFVEDVRVDRLGPRGHGELYSTESQLSARCRSALWAATALQQQDRNLDQMPHLVGGGAEERCP